MDAHRCTRCGDITTGTARNCPRCTAEVAAIIAADTARRTRFAFAKQLDGRTVAL